MSNADLTGRSREGYRGAAIRCPGCAASMRQLELLKAGAEVDVCDACGGLWLDWFDGEMKALAHETLRVSEPSVQTSLPPNEATAAGACPRCARQLVPERYIMKAEVVRDSGRTSFLDGKTDAQLLRCEDCMGSFVPRASAEVLAWLHTNHDEPPPPMSDRKLDPLPWDRFVQVLKGFLGLD